MADNAVTLTRLGAGFSKSAIETLSEIKQEPGWLRARRLEAWHLYEETPMPLPNDELWRRTSLQDLTLDTIVPFSPNRAKGDLTQILPAKYRRVIQDPDASGLLVQYNSNGALTRLADEYRQRGVIFCDLDTAILQYPALVQEYLMTRAVTFTENRYSSAKPTTGAGGKHEGGGYGETVGDLKFTTLHGAFFSGGTFLYVPRNVVVDVPLHTLTYFDEPNLGMFSHTLIVLEENAAVKVVEEQASRENETQRFSSNAVELILRPGASLQYFQIQDLAQNVWHLSSQTALMEKDTSLTWLVGTLGSKVTKAFLDCKLQGTGTNASLLGFFFGDGQQHFDQHTFQNHLQGHSTSDLLYKGALKDKAYSAFRGLIRVNPNAQRSDAYQANRNVLLSEHSHADSIPELEIEANDVRCTHGATVGPIDPEQLFYLMARGIEKIDAERLIVEGFFDPLMQKIPLESVRDELGQAIQTKIGIAG